MTERSKLRLKTKYRARDKVNELEKKFREFGNHGKGRNEYIDSFKVTSY